MHQNQPQSLDESGSLTFPSIECVLEAHCVSDLDVVNAARVSFNKQHDRMEEGDEKLVGYLLKNRHGTPFEHGFFKFRITVPIFVVREHHRHRIGH